MLVVPQVGKAIKNKNNQMITFAVRLASLTEAAIALKTIWTGNSRQPD